MQTIRRSPADGDDHTFIAWIDEQLARRQQRRTAITALPSAASFRRFTRVFIADASFIGMYAPPDRENNPQFVRLSSHLRGHGIPVPEVIAADLERGFLLVTDYGDCHFQQIYGTAQETAALAAAIEALIRIQRIPPSQLIPTYTEARMHDEFELFPTWLVQGLLELEPTKAERSLLDATQQRLVSIMTTQPTCCVHRDYHCQNLLWHEQGGVGIVDFQDALWGPIAYDLASLLRDCYHRFEEGDVARWRSHYLLARRDAGLPRVDADSFAVNMDWTALQRQIKAVGIFSRLALRDGRDRHLRDIAPVLERIIEVAQRYDPLRPFADFIAERVRPAAVAAVTQRHSAPP